MKTFLTLFVLLFSSSVFSNEELYYCKSKQLSSVHYNAVGNVRENEYLTFKFVIDSNKDTIKFIDGVYINGETYSENSPLFLSQNFIITGEDDEGIRAYGTVLGEVMFSKKTKELIISFLLGNGAGVTIADCYR